MHCPQLQFCRATVSLFVDAILQVYPFAGHGQVYPFAGQGQVYITASVVFFRNQEYHQLQTFYLTTEKAISYYNK